MLIEYDFKINEVFYSLQGEGARTGTANIFVRLTGCDLACGFCDTEFESGKDTSVEMLLDILKEYPCKNIIWTGGEPALQLTTDIVAYFKEQGYYQCIETNGNHKVPPNLDYITVSPKVAEHVLKKNFYPAKGQPLVDELRYARHKGQLSVPKPGIKAKHYFISPIFDGSEVDIENLNHCVKLIKENPEWKLSLQTHKLLKIL